MDIQYIIVVLAGRCLTVSEFMLKVTEKVMWITKKAVAIIRERQNDYGDLWLTYPLEGIQHLITIKLQRMLVKMQRGDVTGALDSMCDVLNYFAAYLVRAVNNVGTSPEPK